MKKLLSVGLVLVSAALLTGCVGDAPKQVIGTWEYVPINPYLHDIQWEFTDAGQIYIRDLDVPDADTGTYEIYANGDGRFISISGTDIEDPAIKFNAEWEIIKIEDNILVVGTKDFGGFIQRDLVKL